MVMPASTAGTRPGRVPERIGLALSIVLFGMSRGGLLLGEGNALSDPAEDWEGFQ
jgi:hypothetical protein